MKTTKRCHQVVLKPECYVLKELRRAKQLSMRKAASLLGKSDTYISHIENGRMDIPRGPKLEALLEIYGPIKIRSFKERVRLYKHETSKLEVLEQLTAKLTDEKLEVLINITEQLINQPLVRRP